MAYVHNTAVMVLLASAGIAAAAYIFLVKSGFTPGAKLDDIFQGMQRKVSPNPYKNTETRRNLTLNNLHRSVKENKSEVIDKILDKINQKGYDALTKEEQDALKKASEEIT